TWRGKSERRKTATWASRCVRRRRSCRPAATETRRSSNSGFCGESSLRCRLEGSALVVGFRLATLKLYNQAPQHFEFLLSSSDVPLTGWPRIFALQFYRAGLDPECKRGCHEPTLSAMCPLESPRTNSRTCFSVSARSPESGGLFEVASDKPTACGAGGRDLE